MTTLGPDDDLQTALDSARPGDTIVLAGGAVYRGPFTLPRKDGSDWITVRGPDELLPPAGRRLDPEDARGLPKLVSPGGDIPAVRTAPGAHHFRLIGLEVGPSRPGARLRQLVTLGGWTSQTTTEQVPHHLVLDRVYIHGARDGELRRGVSLNSASTSIVNSAITECKGNGYDSQAIAGWNGPGPFVIENNLLEGAGENLLFGGGDPSLPELVPSDIVIRHNLLRKLPEWRDIWTVKTVLELKNARRVLIDGNVLENELPRCDHGAVQLTVRNQDGRAPWSVVEDVRFTNNVVRYRAGGLNVLGRDDLRDSRASSRLTITNNLFEDLDAEPRGQFGRVYFLKIREAAAVTVERNTVLASGGAVIGWGPPSSGFVFARNDVAARGHAVLGLGGLVGAEAVTRFFADGRFEGNMIVSADSTGQPDAPQRGDVGADLGALREALGDVLASYV